MASLHRVVVKLSPSRCVRAAQSSACAWGLGVILSPDKAQGEVLEAVGDVRMTAVPEQCQHPALPRGLPGLALPPGSC